MNDTTLEKIARIIWNIRREEDDRCLMELEDLSKTHSVWREATAVLDELAKQEPVAFAIGSYGGLCDVYLSKNEAQQEFDRRNNKYPEKSRKLVPLYLHSIPTPEDVLHAKLYRWILDSDDADDVLNKLLTGELTGKEFGAEALAAMTAAQEVK